MGVSANNSSDNDPYAYAASIAPAASTAPVSAADSDPYAYAATAAPAPVAPTPSPDVKLPGSVFGTIPDWAAGVGLGIAAPAAGAIAGGYKGLWDIASGKGLAKASQDTQSTEQDVSDAMGANKPMSEDEKAGISTAQSNWDPLNWPGIAAGWVGHKLGGGAEALGAPPIVSEALDIAPTAALSLLPLMGKTEEAEVAGAKSNSDNPPPPPGGAKAGSTAQPSTEAAATVDDATSDERKTILQSVGIKNARASALSGNKMDAATDYQISKYDQPAGQNAAAQFDHEMNTLANHAAGIVENTGGTLGMDEEALANKGATIDKPFSLARDWFDNQTRNLYAQADARAQGIPVQLQGFNKVLNDDSLMTNQDRMALRNGLKSYVKQLNMTTEGPNGPTVNGTVANAETVRKYLNAEWSPGNSRLVGMLKDSIDDDVTKSAGEDIYGQARAIRALRGRTLDDPNGVSKLFEVDPNTPINRSTPLAKIPQTLTNLSAEQFGNILEILRNMPNEIQPAAQAALGEIRGFMANKLLKAGTENSRGGGRAVWNGDAVTNVLKTNSAKYKLAFQDDPGALEQVQNLNKAGQILKTPTSYPGADVQAANAVKRGLWSRVTPGAARMAGAAAGGVFGPVGAAAGESIGGAAGNVLGLKAAEKGALAGWKKRVVNIEPVSAGGG